MYTQYRILNRFMTAVFVVSPVVFVERQGHNTIQIQEGGLS
jgi:hypothetical protein